MKLKPILLFTLVLLLTCMAKAQTTFGLFDGTTHSQSASATEDANGQIGIGTTAPAAHLHINQGNVTYLNPLEDYFAITQTTTTLSPDPPYTATSVVSTKLIVNADGYVGIGNATPFCPLYVQTHTWYDGVKDIGEPILLFSDPDDNMLGGFFNVGGNTDSNDIGGTFAVATKTNVGHPSFIVYNLLNATIPFGVLDNGTVGMGLDMNSFTPEAQVNIAQSNSYDYLLKMQNADQSFDYFTVHNDGFVGIGAANTGSGQLQVISPSGSTGSATVVVSGNAPDDRFLFIGSGTNPASANTYLSVKSTGVGVGTDDLNNSTLAVKGLGSNLTAVDLLPNGGFPALLRFVSSAGATRHVITEADNNLYILPGGGGNANNKMVVDGTLATNDLEVANDIEVGRDAIITRNETVGGNANITGNLTVTNNASIAQDATVSGTFLSQSLAKATGRFLVGTNAQNSAYNSHKMVVTDGSAYFGGTVTFNDKIFTNGVIQIGNVQPPSGYANYKLSVNGQIAAQEVNVITNAGWFDYVFDDDYKLQTLSDLKKYVKENKHLPDIPSEEDVCKKGVNLGEMNSLLLKKVEELYLYVIQLEERMNKIETK